MFQEVKIDFRTLKTQFQDDIIKLGAIFEPSHFLVSEKMTSNINDVE